MFDAVNIHIAFDILWKVLHLIFHYATKIEVAATDKKRQSNYSDETFKLKFNAEYQYTLISSIDTKVKKPTWL
jgi:hypothetical protein